MIMQKITSNTHYPTLKKLTGNIYFVLGFGFFMRMLMLLVIGKPWNESNWKEWIWMPDTNSYINFANDLYNHTFHTLPFRLPGYPFFLMLTRNMLPVEWLGTILIQQGIMIFIAWLLYRIARRYTDTYSLLVPLFFLFEPATFMYSFKLLPESFMILLITTSVFLIMQAASTKGINTYVLVIASALLLCLGIFFKPILMYSFLLYLGFIFIFFKDTFWKKLVFALIFIVIIQYPVHLFRQYYQHRFGVYTLTSQEFSEKAARAIDIKYLAVYHKVLSTDHHSEEIHRTMIASGYDYNKPDYQLYRHVADSITSANIKKYPFMFVYHSFAESYLFFEPGTKIYSEFFLIKPPEKTGHPATVLEKLVNLLHNSSAMSYLPIIIFSFAYSLLLVVPFFIAIFNASIRKLYAPVIYFACMWFVYTSVLCGRIAQTGYRNTFAWSFTILAGFVCSYIATNGWKNVIPFRKSVK